VTIAAYLLLYSTSSLRWEDSAVCFSWLLKYAAMLMSLEVLQNIW